MLDSAIGAVETLQPIQVYQLKKILNLNQLFQQFNFYLDQQLDVVNNWQPIMTNIGEFSKEGDRNIVIDGAPGVRFTGNIKSNLAWHICAGSLPTNCKVEMRNVDFDVRKTYRRHGRSRK